MNRKERRSLQLFTH